MRAVLNRPWSLDDARKAKRALDRLASQLDEACPGAANSLREGLEETLTLIALGASGALYKTLCSTNPSRTAGHHQARDA